MTKAQIFQLICDQINIVIPELMQHPIAPTHSLKVLGANSIDRAEIIMLTMAALKVKIPLIEFAKVDNIQGIVDVFYHQIILADSISGLVKEDKCEAS